MITLSEICQLIKNELETRKYRKSWDTNLHDLKKSLGMCDITQYLVYKNIINSVERKMWRSEYQKYLEDTGQKLFYWSTKEPNDNRNGFGWPVEDKQSRIDWLNKRINS